MPPGSSIFSTTASTCSQCLPILLFLCRRLCSRCICKARSCASCRFTSSSVGGLSGGLTAISTTTWLMPRGLGISKFPWRPLYAFPASFSFENRTCACPWCSFPRSLRRLLCLPVPNWATLTASTRPCASHASRMALLTTSGHTSHGKLPRKSASDAIEERCDAPRAPRRAPARNSELNFRTPCTSRHEDGKKKWANLRDLARVAVRGV
mmetsp:Transcript_9360/g.57055  ORF Transcript_9360/g.57055 Transcript_9360/m.57055 type:complete len:209 (+) Transcript_9360:964-1590(+)